MTDTKSKLDDFIQALYDAGWKAPCDAQWENIKVVYENFCTDLTQCQEVERLKAALLEAMEWNWLDDDAPPRFDIDNLPGLEDKQ